MQMNQSINSMFDKKCEICTQFTSIMSQQFQQRIQQQQLEVYFQAVGIHPVYQWLEFDHNNQTNKNRFDKDICISWSVFTCHNLGIQDIPVCQLLEPEAGTELVGRKPGNTKIQFWLVNSLPEIATNVKCFVSVTNKG